MLDKGLVINDYFQRIFAEVYDLNSSKQTQRLLELVNELAIFETVPDCAKKLQECFVALKLTVVNALESHVLLFPTDWAARNVGTVLEFTSRQFWRGVKVRY